MHALEVAPGLLIGLFAGVWVDRLRRRPLMIWADLGRALLLGSIPLAYVLGHLTLVQVYAVVLLISVLTLLFEVAYQSYLPDLVPSDALVAANSRLQASFSVAEISGFSLGGVLVQLLTAPLTVLFDALSFLASAVSLASGACPSGPFSSWARCSGVFWGNWWGCVEPL
ncbi:MAG: MFS transporter [Firmicutes bacterium]|nr:MFS transporter [Bacillota bacterium]